MDTTRKTAVLIRKLFLSFISAVQHIASPDICDNLRIIWTFINLGNLCDERLLNISWAGNSMVIKSKCLVAKYASIGCITGLSSSTADA